MFYADVIVIWKLMAVSSLPVTQRCSFCHVKHTQERIHWLINGTSQTQTLTMTPCSHCSRETSGRHVVFVLFNARFSCCNHRAHTVHNQIFLLKWTRWRLSQSASHKTQATPRRLQNSSVLYVYNKVDRPEGSNYEVLGPAVMLRHWAPWGCYSK